MTRKFVAAFLAIFALVSCESATARVLRGTYFAGAAGNAVLNLGDNNPANFVNLFHVSGTTVAAADVAKLDANGYFIARPAADVFMFTPAAGTFWANTNYVLAGSSTRLQPIKVLSGQLTCSSPVNVTVTGCTGSGNSTFTPTGAGAWSVTIAVGTDLGAWYWNGTGGTYAPGSGAITLSRSTDAARLAAGLIFTSEFEALVAGAAPNPLRNMPWVSTGPANYNNETLWSYRKTLSSFSFAGEAYPPGAIVSGVGSPVTVTNGGSSTTITAAAATDTPGSLTDGEVAIGVCSATNTFASPTLDVGSRTPKPVYSFTGDPLSASAIASGGICFFTYKAIYDGWLYGSPATAQGIQWSLPVEAFTQLANRISKDAWFSLPFMASDSYVSSWATAVCSGLNSPLYPYFQYSNEVWNAQFPQWGYAYNAGYKLGWVLQSAQNVDSFYALRFKQMMDIVNPICGASRARGAMDYQGAAVNDTGRMVDQRLKGVQLVNNKQTTSSVTITVGSPCQITWPFNGFLVDWPVSFTGTLPTGITPAQVYYIKTNTPNNDNIASTLTIAAAPGGSAINCSGSASGVTGSYVNPFYSALINQNYSTGSPTFSRPGDVAYLNGMAPYAAGENLCTGDDIACTPAAKNAPFLQSLVTTWESGDSAGAIALVDSDIRVGTTNGQTVTAVGTLFTTAGTHGFNTSTDLLCSASGGTGYSGVSLATLYRVTATPASNTFRMQGYNTSGVPAGADINAGSAGTGTMSCGISTVNTLARLASTWVISSQQYAAALNGDRPPGKSNLFNTQYEGNLEPKGPTAGQCTSLGITGSDCAGSIQAAITAWKNSASAKATMILYYQQFMGRDAGTPATFGLMSNSKAPAQLTLMPGGGSCSNNIYAMISGCLPNDMPFQTYYGFRDFSLQNFLLRRDLNPASNDNDPMWLEKAA